MSSVNLPLIDRKPYAVGTATFASGLAAITSFVVKIPLPAKLALAGTGMYGIILSTWLGLRQVKPLTGRDLILIAGGATCAALSWYKLSDLIPPNSTDISMTTILAFEGASIGSLAIPFLGKAFDCVRSSFAKPSERPPYEPLLPEAEPQNPNLS